MVIPKDSHNWVEKIEENSHGAVTQGSSPVAGLESASLCQVGHSSNGTWGRYFIVRKEKAQSMFMAWHVGAAVTGLQ